jgi:hypothetical protein
VNGVEVAGASAMATLNDLASGRALLGIGVGATGLLIRCPLPLGLDPPHTPRNKMDT